MNLSTRPAEGLCDLARRNPGLARRLGLLVAGFLVFAMPAFAQDRPTGFGLETVAIRAKALADTPYVAPVSNLPDVFSTMQFYDYQKIQPRRDRSVWADIKTPFQLSFYHQGMHFNTPVKIN